MFFPEGTRSTTDALRPFKLGAFISAIRTGCPLLPIAVHGTRGGMPKGSPWIRKTVVRARVLSPIPTDGLKLADAAALAERVHAQIVEARNVLARLAAEA
jgi:1-acyl-sn-glycerol-3-phosphate acyltransferase